MPERHPWPTGVLAQWTRADATVAASKLAAVGAPRPGAPWGAQLVGGEGQQVVARADGFVRELVETRILECGRDAGDDALGEREIGRAPAPARTVVARSACVKFGHVDNLPPEMERVSRAELQAAILRFEGTLNARLTQAFEPLVASVRGEVRLRAMRDHLVYVASALDIATAPVPEANLLDMVAFVELARDTCRTRWNVDLHGEHGAAVLAALDAASTDVWRVARALLSPEKEEELRRLVREWHDENPGLTEIAAVRLPAFSAVAGRGETRAEVAAHGIFSYVKKGVTEADMARLLGERALFLALRMPFLVRLQARLAAHEVTQEVVHELPDRLAQTVTAVAERAGPLMRRAIGAGAIATAGLVTAGALAYVAVRRQGRPT